MSGASEIERKWLVENLPPEVEGGRWDTRRLEQGYLAVSDDVEVRGGPTAGTRG
jgi:adenylate cyclase